MLILDLLRQQATAAIDEALGVTVDPIVRVAPNPAHGDYAVEGVLGLGRALKQPPRRLAEAVARALDPGDLLLAPEVAGPGFINLRLRDEWLGRTLAHMLAHARVAIDPVAAPETVVVDFSSPNVAKRMHIGHMRSTNIGASIVHTLRFLGHRVIGDNHVGDWGTQFGTLLWAYTRHVDHDALVRDPIGELERLYRVGTEASRDPVVADACRAELCALQAGDPARRALWRRFVDHSEAAAQRLYRRLGVRFDVWLGESAYHHMLDGIVQELVDSDLARESEGAKAVFFPGHPELEDEPFLVQKSDGAFLYATTDIATIRYRAATWQPDRIIYVVDVRQSLHFKQLFETARRLGHRDMRLEHVGFGMMLGMDGRPFRTRSGGTLELETLLDEAEARARPLVDQKWPDASSAERDAIARDVGSGAVVYADLAHNLETDYRFDLEQFVSFDGNTGPYLQYTLARARSVLREQVSRFGRSDSSGEPLSLGTTEDRALAIRLIRVHDVLADASRYLRPHFLCDFAYDVARSFNALYAKHSILNVSDTRVRTSRLGLTTLVVRVLEIALGCLNIPRPERM